MHYVLRITISFALVWLMNCHKSEVR